MLIEFTRAERRASIATLHRGDGVVLELRAYDRKFRIPHDLAHAVTERELGLADGVFGSIAGGAVFASMRVLSGRPRHDAAARSRRILHANRASLSVAEVMAGMVHDAAEHTGATGAHAKARIDWAQICPDPFPFAPERIDAAVRALIDLGGAWERTGRIEFFWPDRLASPVPAPGGGVRRGRTGRR